MYFDVSGGYWLYQNPGGRWLTGLAGILELHYSTTIQDTDTIAGPAGNSFLFFSNTFNRVDVLNLTAGLHIQLTECTTVRLAGVAPLRSTPADFFGGVRASNKFFDSEIQVQINRRF